MEKFDSRFVLHSRVTVSHGSAAASSREFGNADARLDFGVSAAGKAVSVQVYRTPNGYTHAFLSRPDSDEVFGGPQVWPLIEGLRGLGVDQVTHDVALVTQWPNWPASSDALRRVLYGDPDVAHDKRNAGNREPEGLIPCLRAAAVRTEDAATRRVIEGTVAALSVRDVHAGEENGFPLPRIADLPAPAELRRIAHVLSPGTVTFEGRGRDAGQARHRNVQRAVANWMHDNASGSPEADIDAMKRTVAELWTSLIDVGATVNSGLQIQAHRQPSGEVVVTAATDSTVPQPVAAPNISHPNISVDSRLDGRIRRYTVALAAEPPNRPELHGFDGIELNVNPANRLSAVEWALLGDCITAHGLPARVFDQTTRAGRTSAHRISHRPSAYRSHRRRRSDGSLRRCPLLAQPRCRPSS